MRIIGGRLGGRRLPAGVPRGARPTSDRVREAIASVLQSRGAIADVTVLDLFAGSGALGLEALSRGALHVCALDRNAAAGRAITENARALGVEQALTFQRVDLLGTPEAVAERIARLQQGPFGLIFVDPPYADTGRCGALLDELVQTGQLAAGALVVVEHAADSAPVQMAALVEAGAYRYGDTAVTLYEPAA